ncbi:MAG: HD domain-containing protein [Bacillota bacterium]
MEKIDKIIANHVYNDYVKRNSNAENERVFCCHRFDHLVDTARLTYILILEEGNPFISREIAYAAGLLHDIGRWTEYQTGTDHAKTSAELAEDILFEAGFSSAETQLIQKAISEHRNKNISGSNRSSLSAALARADSLTRKCFCCSSKKQCNKFEQQPNRNTLIY